MTVKRKKLNFDEIIQSIKEKLQMWKWRDLSILGLGLDFCNTRQYLCIESVKRNHDRGRQITAF